MYIVSSAATIIQLEYTDFRINTRQRQQAEIRKINLVIIATAFEVKSHRQRRSDCDESYSDFSSTLGFSFTISNFP